MRIGVGNRILRNHRYFIDSGKNIVRELTEKEYLNPESQVLELGCGCGRTATALLHFLNADGTYVGQDVDEQMIDWCHEHLQNQRFQFHHANVFSAVYNPNGTSVENYDFPLEDNAISLIISVSVFSHLLFKDFSHYVAESYRVLSPGGFLHMTLFIMDFVRPKLGNRWSFSHKLDNCYVDSLRYPEAAVAYDLEVVERLFSDHRFSIVKIYNKDLHQQTIVAQKNHRLG